MYPQGIIIHKSTGSEGPSTDRLGGGGSLRLMALGSFFGPHTGHLRAKLQDAAVMHHPVDGGCGCQRILENLIPLREDQIGGDDYAAAFVPFGTELFIMRYSLPVTYNG